MERLAPGLALGRRSCVSLFEYAMGSVRQQLSGISSQP